jgi:hypothetical protein
MCKCGLKTAAKLPFTGRYRRDLFIDRLPFPVVKESYRVRLTELGFRAGSRQWTRQLTLGGQRQSLRGILMLGPAIR